MGQFDLFLSAVVAAYALAMAVLWGYVRAKKAEREKGRQDFESTLKKAVEESSLSSLRDVNDLYLAHFGLKDPILIDFEDVGLYLRKLKLHFATAIIQARLKRQEIVGIVDQLISDSNEVLKKAKERAPFSGVPSPERDYLEDILEITKPEEKAIYRQRLDDLSSAIKVRQETTEKLTKEQAESLKWTKLGLYATVLLSAISIGLTVWLASAPNKATQEGPPPSSAAP